MAVIAKTIVSRYEGLSTDTKPTSGVPTGWEFYETNTGKRFRFDGSAWQAWGIETIAYAPGLQNTGDLEAATTTITAGTEPGADTYSAALTLPSPSDGRLVVKRIGVRHSLTIDTADGDLRVRVYVDTVATANLLFDLTLTGTGNKLNVVDKIDTDADLTIFNLLKDGAAHTFKWRIWKTGGGAGAVISVVNLWEAVGNTTAGSYGLALQLTHKGFYGFQMESNMVGTGNYALKLSSPASISNAWRFSYDSSSQSSWFGTHHPSDAGRALGQPRLSPDEVGIQLGDMAVATDLAYILGIAIVLKGEA